MAAAAAPARKEALPAALGSASEPPALFDGTTRLYICYFCPFAQRTWVARNFKVPALEHNGKIMGESLDLIKYIDSNFEGPALLPEDPEKRQFADELIEYANAFTKTLYSPLISKVDLSDETVAALDKIEAALSKFSDGPFFLGQFSLVDIAYVTILERIQIYYSHLRSYEITDGRTSLEKFIEEINKIEAYTQTKNDPLLPELVARDELLVR
uniref:GST N-terminal domain-containing protein n=1 Tax=Leersia perrieri TaxID=77586 RepID=A0A0D9VSN8_9ORYZ